MNNQLMLSKQLSATEVKTVYYNNIQDLSEFITTSQWCPGTFKARSQIEGLTSRQSNRKNEFFISAPSIFGIDIDNTYTKNQQQLPELTMAEAEVRLKQLTLSYIIAPTKTNKQIKEGHEAAGAVERYRIILFLSRPINTVEDYRSVYKYVLKHIFPEMDIQCSDPARFYYPSTHVEYASKDYTQTLAVDEILIKAKAARDIQLEALNATVQSKKQTAVNKDQRYPRYVSEVMINRSLGEGGGRNNTLYKVGQWFVENRGYNFEQLYENLHDIAIDSGLTEEETISTLKSALNTKITFTLDADMNGGLYRKLTSSRLIYNVDDTSDIVFVFNENEDTYDTFDMSVTNKIFPAELQPLIKARTTAAKIVYEPFNKNIFQPANEDHGEVFHKFNIYQHPEWRKEVVNSEESIKILPELYHKFFMHIVKGDEKSYEYVLDWLSNALVSRNLTVLCAIASEEGTGKGVLGEIMRNLVGDSNFNKVRDEIFKNKFNNGLRNKRIVQLDEIKLRTDDEMNKFKDIINNSIEIEQKGKDAESLPNYASFYLSSNNIDAIKPSSSDRRFSIVEMSETKLVKVFSKQEINQLASGYLIEQVGSFLLNREIKNDMFLPFKSSQYEHVREAALAPWQEYMLEDFFHEHKGREISIKALQQELKDVVGLHYVPGRIKIQRFCKDNPDYFQWRNKSDGSRTITCLKSKYGTQTIEDIKATNQAAPTVIQPTAALADKIKALKDGIGKQKPLDKTPEDKLN